MAWSIFSNGGGNGAAVTWAKDFLTALGAPVTSGNMQFVYDWELAEGGGGKYNPLNQGPVPGHSELTTTGSQYGGGAADYASYNAGIQGAVDYVNMPNYTAVKAALMNNDPAAARSALIQSPWAASHYGNGSSFPNTPISTAASPLMDNGQAVDASFQNAGGSLTAGVPGWMKSLVQGLMPSSGTDFTKGAQGLIIRGSLVVFGGIILIVGLIQLAGSNKTAKTIVEAPGKGARAVVGKAIDSGG